jgi:hypothetical protein
MDIIIPRDIIEDIGRPKKNGAGIIIKKKGIKITTMVMPGRSHEDKLQC